MRFKALLSTAVAIVATGVLALAALAGTGSDAMTMKAKQTGSTARATLTAADLRVTLDTLLSEHAAFAMNATNAGITGNKSFPATAKALDQNSVALSRAIGSIYGKPAGNTFLNGKFMWRQHIAFFVDYTVAKAKRDTAGQNKAVANLKQYTVTFGDFLAGATGLPKLAVRNDLLGHVLELKGQLDSYAAGNYPKAAGQYRAAFAHMFMTGDLLAGAIAKQKGLAS